MTITPRPEPLIKQHTLGAKKAIDDAAEVFRRLPIEPSDFSLPAYIFEKDNRKKNKKKKKKHSLNVENSMNNVELDDRTMINKETKSLERVGDLEGFGVVAVRTTRVLIQHGGSGKEHKKKDNEERIAEMINDDHENVSTRLIAKDDENLMTRMVGHDDENLIKRMIGDDVENLITRMTVNDDEDVIVKKIGDDDGKGWNMRPRRPKGVVERKKAGSEKAEIVVRGTESRKEEKNVKPSAKLCLSLSREEIMTDLIAFRALRPCKKPKKRPRSVQNELNMMFPCSAFGFITPELYEVRTAKRKDD